MVTAAKARKLTDKANSNQTREREHKKFLKDILTDVKTLAKDGHDWFFFTCDDATGSYVRENLEALGFKVTIKVPPNLSHLKDYEVSW